MATKLYLLKSRTDLASNKNPWEPWYDCTFQMVVRAHDETEARKIAGEYGGEEVRQAKSKRINPDDVWGSDKYSTCEELTADGEPDLIISYTAEA